jgi:hypothetical protein
LEPWGNLGGRFGKISQNCFLSYLFPVNEALNCRVGCRGLQQWERHNINFR